MSFRLVLSIVFALLLLIDTTLASLTIRLDSVSRPTGSGNVLVGVFALSNANVQLGGFDIPIDFGTAGPTVLPTGVNYLGVTNTIFSSGSTLASVLDPFEIVDYIVSDATTSNPPSFPLLTSGIEAKLFDLSFNVGPTAVVGSTFSIAVSGTHPFFQLNDNTNIPAPIPVTGFTAGSLTITAIPEPTSLLLFGLAAIVAESRRRLRLRA